MTEIKADPQGVWTPRSRPCRTWRRTARSQRAILDATIAIWPSPTLMERPGRHRHGRLGQLDRVHEDVARPRREPSLTADQLLTEDLLP